MNWGKKFCPTVGAFFQANVSSLTPHPAFFSPPSPSESLCLSLQLSVAFFFAPQVSL
jgi:hypothetical protein